MSEYTDYKLAKVWDYNLAVYVWVLSGLRKFEVFTADIIEDVEKDGKVRDEIAVGDKAWAERTAAHFGIKLPTEVK